MNGFKKSGKHTTQGEVRERGGGRGAARNRRACVRSLLKYSRVGIDQEGAQTAIENF